DIAARLDPGTAPGRETLLDIDRDAIVRIRTGCVVESDRGLAARERDLAERHARDMDFLRARKGPAGKRDGFRIADGFVHSPLPPPVLTGSGSKGLAGLRSQLRSERPWGRVDPTERHPCCHRAGL